MTSLRWMILMTAFTTAVLLGAGALLGLYMHPVFTLSCVVEPWHIDRAEKITMQCTRSRE